MQPTTAQAWPVQFRDWRLRRTSVREFVTSYAVLVACAFAAVPAMRLAASLGTRVRDLPFLAVWTIAVLACRAALKRRRRAGESERAAAVLRDPAALIASDPPLDGERRGVLDRTAPLRLLPSALAAIVGLIVLAVGGRGGSLLATAVGGALVLPMTWIAIRHVWQGGVEVRWVPDSLVAGRRATFFVGTPDGGSRLLDAQFLLRCTEPVPGHAPGWQSVVEAGVHQAPGPGEFVEVSFWLPDRAPISDLSAEPPVYWELVVRGRTMWGVVTESFLVPVRRERAA